MPEDSSLPELVIHVGYHKAGSTLLQRQLFLPERGASSPWPQRFYHQHVLLDRPDRGWATRIKRAFEPGIAAAHDAGLVPVLSCEALSGDIWRVGQANGYANFHVADALATAFPGARVVIVHREQNAMIGSLYKHSIRSHWRWDLPRFLDQAPKSRGMAPVFNLGYLEYSHLLEHYQDRFGVGEVAAVPFELIRDKPAWASRWSAILGTNVDPRWFDARENPAMSGLVVQAKRRANYLIPASAEPNRSRAAKVINGIAHRIDLQLPASGRARADARLRDEVDRSVGDYYGVDNARLAELTGESWAVFGYRTAT